MKTGTRPVELAINHRNLSWYGRLCAALCEAGRPDIATRVGVRGPDRLYDDEGIEVGMMLGGSCPTFVFEATEDEWRLVGRAAALTQQGRPGLHLRSEEEMILWATRLGRVVS